MKPEADTELDLETRETLNRIIHKEEAELTDFDRAFLVARSSYIKDKHKPKFPSVFGANNETVYTPTEQEEVNHDNALNHVPPFIDDGEDEIR